MAATAVEPEGPSTRERLCRAALRLFAERGYAGVSNREIVEACGLTKGAIYWYFESKEHLFRSVVAETLADFQVRVMQATQSADDWLGRLAAMFGLFVETLENPDDPHRDLLIIMIHRLPGGPGQDDLGQAAQQRFLDWVEEVTSDDPSRRGREVAALVYAAGLGVLVQAAAGQDVARPVLGALLRLLGGGDLPASPARR